MADAQAVQFPGGRIVRSENPLNLEMPFETLEGFITPIESFYVRCHFPIPEIDRKSWRLRVEGEVERAFDIGYGELLRLESRTVPATLECAGNTRNLLDPKVKGVQWRFGAVGNAEWTGVPLSALLDRARIKSGACEVILEGADSGPVEEAKKPSGNIRFARSVPLAKALDDVLLAYKINGEELPAKHGFPLRAIVPGWYAVASIKWLQRIVVTNKPFQGFYQTLDYSYWKPDGDLAELVPIQEMQTKAQISQPTENSVFTTGSIVTVRGAAWAGGSDITKVEVSADGGASWEKAELEGGAVGGAWRLWRYQWKAPAASGACQLMARATDSRGQTQPVERDPNRGTYMINHLLPITVQVEAASEPLH